MPCSIRKRRETSNGIRDNGQTVKLVCVHEGYTDSGEDSKRKELKNVVYFGGLYRGKDNEKLCAVSRDEFTADGMVQAGCGQPGTYKNILENGGDMLELVQRQKEKDTEEIQEDEKYFSASEILSWEKKHSKANGKYAEALQARMSSQISGKILFNNAISSVC